METSIFDLENSINQIYPQTSEIDTFYISDIEGLNHHKACLKTPEQLSALLSYVLNN